MTELIGDHHIDIPDELWESPPASGTRVPVLLCLDRDIDGVLSAVQEAFGKLDLPQVKVHQTGMTLSAERRLLHAKSDNLGGSRDIAVAVILARFPGGRLLIAEVLTGKDAPARKSAAERQKLLSAFGTAFPADTPPLVTDETPVVPRCHSGHGRFTHIQRSRHVIASRIPYLFAPQS